MDCLLSFWHAGRAFVVAKRSISFFAVALRPPPVADKGSKSAVQNKELKDSAPSCPHNDYILDWGKVTVI